MWTVKLRKIVAPRWFWGAIYFLLIPIFALIYTFLYNDFQFSTLHHEPALYEEIFEFEHSMYALTDNCYPNDDFPFQFHWNTDFENGQIEITISLNRLSMLEFWSKEEEILPFLSASSSAGYGGASYQQTGLSPDAYPFDLVVAFAVLSYPTLERPGSQIINIKCNGLQTSGAGPANIG